jgi:cbb3-type cytochrome oxidase subunit 1
VAANTNADEQYSIISPEPVGSTIRWLIAGVGTSLIVILLAIKQTTFSYPELFNDPADTMKFNPFIGLVSMLGLFGWAATAGVAFLTYVVVRSRETALMRQFFLAAGIFTLFLLVDDAFMLHEDVLPHAFGIRERYTKAGYLIVAAAFGLSFFRVLIRNNFSLLVAAGTFFAGSLLLDNPAILKAMGWWENDFVLYVLEDGSKFTGIILWMAYLTKTASETLDRLMRN